MTVAPELLAPADRRLWDAMGAAAPVWSTMPTPGASHELAACQLVARMLGTPLLPWQEWTCRLATERRLDDTRRYRWPMFLLTVPRQAGKTTVVRVILLVRAILYTGRRSFYTAQTGKDATERWADLCAAVMRRGCPLAPYATLRRAAGSARLTITATDSRLAPFAPTPESLHGYTPHDVAVDELFAFTDAEGADLEGAIIPAQLTLPDRQLLMLSTAGNRSSTYLRRKVDEGRAAAEVGESDLAYIEWSMPEGADPYSPDTWSFHPAYGLTQQVEDFQIAAQQLPPGEWLRAMMNVWSESSEPLFDMGAYDACRVDELSPVALGSTVVGVGVDPGRSRAALVAAWPLSSTTGSRIGVKLLRTGTVPDVEAYLRQLAGAEPADRPVVYGTAGAQQVRSTLDELVRHIGPYAVTKDVHARRVVELDSREWSLASAQLHSAIVEGRLAHELDDGATKLRTGIAGALAKPAADGWQLSPLTSPESQALAAAVRGARVKVDTPRVVIRS